MLESLFEARSGHVQNSKPHFSNGFARFVHRGDSIVQSIQPGGKGNASATCKNFRSTADDAIFALLAVNDGKPPATGDQLWKSLGKLGDFAQLPIVYSAVRLDSTLSNPRVIIAPLASKLSDADANKPNLVGRLYMAVNMENAPKGGDPRVTSLEFISWNTTRRQFDFGVIENMGGISKDSKPEFRLVDGGKCFACHKNRGPILGKRAPWTNSTLHPGVRGLVASRLNMVSFVRLVVPPAVRNRIDGMALVSPEAVAVDKAVAFGRQLRIYREIFRLMNRSSAGRQAFLVLLEGILEPGVLDNSSNAEIKHRVNTWAGDPSESFNQFQSDLYSLLKTTNTGVLIDFAPFTKNLPKGTLWGNWPKEPTWGSSSNPRTVSDALQRQSQNFRDDLKNAAFQNAKMIVVLEYDYARAEGKHDMPSYALPSNPKAFSTQLPAIPRLPSSIVNTFFLAGTIGLTEGDRHFMTECERVSPTIE